MTSHSARAPRPEFRKDGLRHALTSCREACQAVFIGVVERVVWTLAERAHARRRAGVSHNTRFTDLWDRAAIEIVAQEIATMDRLASASSRETGSHADPKGD